MDSKATIQDEAVIYVALKDVLNGILAQIRQSKAIRRAISLNSKVKKVADLLKTHQEQVIVDTTRHLLSEEIFASTEKAKLRFLWLFKSLSFLKAERTASSEEAVQGKRSSLSTERIFSDGETAVACIDTAMASQSWKPIQASAMAKQLFPVHLPFRAQHQLLVHLQQLLELSAAASLGLRRSGGAQPVGSGPVQEIDEPEREKEREAAGTAFASITNIRHTAVHRNRISAAALEDFFRDAEAFTALLGDTKTTETIARMRQEIKTTIEELERNTKAVHSKLDRTMHEIGAKREELRRLEKEALDDVQRENGECQGMAARSIDTVIAPPKPLSETAPVVENDMVVEDETTINKGFDYMLMDEYWR
ncbi:hypothetical protein PG997_007212 [Apiospora hydei]|uniref:Uncharacterized protein n=1 Tax=Apiospora hydei TaxID=1337664 RepID=A0ABR1W7D2_9PEZI